MTMVPRRLCSLLICLLTIPCGLLISQESPEPPTLESVLSGIAFDDTFSGVEVREILREVVTIADEEIERAAETAAQAVADRCNQDKRILTDARHVVEADLAAARGTIQSIMAERDKYWTSTAVLGFMTAVEAVIVVCLFVLLLTK